jgi:hypothetical protein
MFSFLAPKNKCVLTFQRNLLSPPSVLLNLFQVDAKDVSSNILRNVIILRLGMAFFAVVLSNMVILLIPDVSKERAALIFKV